MELVFALDLFLAAALFWALALRRWEAAGGALLALAGSLPLLLLLLRGEFRASAALLCLTTLAGGGLILVRGFAGDGRA